MTRTDARPDGRVVVDPSSIGGRCDDGRTLKEAESPAKPLCTLARAVSLARGGGVRIAARRGTYPRLMIGGRRSTRAYLTIEAYEGERAAVGGVTIEPGASRIRLRGLRLGSAGGRAPALEVREEAHHLRLESSRIDSSADAVRLDAGSHDVLIQHNRIHTTGTADGITLNSTSALPGTPYPAPRPPISRVTIRGNRIAGVGTDAIRPANFRDLLVEGNDISGVRERGEHSDALQTVWGGTGLVFRRNLVHDNVGQGFFINDGQVRNVVVAGNVFARNARGAQIQTFDTIGLRIMNNTVWGEDYGVALRTGVKRVTVRNNILNSLNVYGPRAVMRREITQDHNLIAGGWSWGAAGATDSAARPRFADPERLDFRPAPGSPAVDAGSSTGAPMRDGACRRRVDVPGVSNRGAGPDPWFDIGALELVPGSSAPAGPHAC